MKRIRGGIALIIVLALGIAGVTWWLRPPSSHHVREGQTSARPSFPEAPGESPGSPAPLDSASPGPDSLRRLLFGNAWGREEDPAFRAFHQWAERYLAATDTERGALLEEGIRLAAARRARLAEWIRSDPERAIDAAVPVRIRNGLPPEILAQLEERISARGDLLLMAALPNSGERVDRPVWRQALVEGRELDAYGYGRRREQMTEYQVPLHGIALDRDMALHESPLRLLEAGEVIGGRRWVASCPISQQVSPQAVKVDVGDEVVGFCQPGHVLELEQRLIDAEAVKGPVAAQGGGPGGEEPPVLASAWTEGQKKVLYIRLDFPDVQVEPITQDAAQNMIDQNCNNFYRSNSYFKTSLVGTITPKVYRLPKNGQVYAEANDYNGINTDARALVEADGMLYSSFDRVVCAFPNIGTQRFPNSKFGWAGLAQVGGKISWLNGSFGQSVTCHEIGHNYGLLHANFWDAGNSSVVGPGDNVEYGDPFDVMGGGSGDRGHFNINYKRNLDWATDANLLTVTNSGTFRVYRFDHPDATGVQAIRIPRKTGETYWIAFRQLYTNNASLFNGAYVFWRRPGMNQSLLLDMTPGSANGNADLQDAALTVGTTFSDPDEELMFKPIAKGGTSPNEYLDIEIKKGPFIPEITSQPQNQTVVSGMNVTLTVAANGTPPLSFQWLQNGNPFRASSTNAPLAFTNVQASQTGDYRVIVSNEFGSVTSVVARLTVKVGMDAHWSRRGGGAREDAGHAVAVDGAGNLLVTGFFQGSATFGSTTLDAGPLASDLFVAKYDPSGTLLWVRQAGSLLGEDRGHDLATDSGGNVYVTGQIATLGTFGAPHLFVAPRTDAFLAKYGPDGTLLWMRQVGSPHEDDSGASVAVAPSGDVLLTGHFRGAALIGTSALTNAGGSDLFLAKFDPEGNALWARAAGGPGDDLGTALAVDGSGAVFVAGLFRNSATVGTQTLTSSGGADVLLAKWSAEGEWQWVRKGGSPDGDDAVAGLALDPSGQPVAVGHYPGTAVWGSTTLISRGETDIFIVKHDSAGTLLWARREGGATFDEAFGVAVDSLNTTLVSGLMHGTAPSSAILASSRAELAIIAIAPDGSLLQTQMASLTGYNFARGIAVGADSTAYATGVLGGSAYFGDQTLASAGAGDLFVSKFRYARPPQLTIARVGSQVVLAWPESQSGYLPEATTALGSAWTALGISPTLLNGSNTVTVPLAEPRRFFRLRK